jgi:hypothetical protein
MNQVEHFSLIIGAMKCGTTSLFKYLEQHPQICPSIDKEPMFFSKDNWTQGLSSYQKIWNNYDSKIHKTRLEGSVSYTKFPDHPNAAERIYQFSCDYNVRFKFIYIMRNPLDAISSGLHHGFYTKWCANKENLIEHLLRVYKYSEQIEKYYEKFSQEDILLVQLEELITNPTDLIKKIFVFLNVDSSFQVKNWKRVYNSSKEHEREKERKALYRTFLEQNKPIKYVSNLFPQKAQKLAEKVVYKSTSRYFPHFIKKEQQQWSLNEDEKKAIANELQESLSELETKYKVDVSKWQLSRSLSI